MSQYLSTVQYFWAQLFKVLKALKVSSPGLVESSSTHIIKRLNIFAGKMQENGNVFAFDMFEILCLIN